MSRPARAAAPGARALLRSPRGKKIIYRRDGGLPYDTTTIPKHLLETERPSEALRGAGGGPGRSTHTNINL